jgi:hypothetical protein
LILTLWKKRKIDFLRSRARFLGCDRKQKQTDSTAVLSVFLFFVWDQAPPRAPMLLGGLAYNRKFRISIAFFEKIGYNKDTGDPVSGF